MRKILYVIIIILIAKIAFSEAIDDTYKITPEDFVIDEIEYYFEPKENPIMLIFSVKITNKSNRSIKYAPNVHIPHMSMLIDHTDHKCIISNPGETCILRGYGYRKRFDEKEYQVIPANTYFTIIATVSPPHVVTPGTGVSLPRPITDDSIVKKSIIVVREE